MTKKLSLMALAVLWTAACLADGISDFGKARWLWPRELGAVTNTTVEFCQAFKAGGSAPVTLAIAADTVYAVELNGRFVYAGRFPDVPPQRYYDVLPLGSVRPGENELKVSLYVQGIDSFQTLPGDPGVMFALSGDGVEAVSGTKTKWRLSTADRRAGVPMVTSQLGFSFEYDATRTAAEWEDVDDEDAVRGPGDFALEPRPVPRVEILPEIPVRLVAQGLLDGSSVPDDVSPGMDATPMTEVPAADFFAADGKSVRREHFAKGFFVLVDLGREEAGFLSLDVDTDAGAVIDIGHAEHMEQGRIRTHIGTRNFAGRYRARDGRQSYCRWARRMAGRYIQLHVRGVKTHFVLHRVSLKPTLLPVNERPAPAGLSAFQRRIWDTSVRTLRLSMHEHYEDCPWREQALYGNDARNQMLCGYYAFDASNRMPELALQVLGRGLGEDGWIELCMPAKISITIPSFTFCWVMSVADNLKFRGDSAFTKKLMPTVKKILDRRLSEMKDGLLPCPTGARYWQFYEWAKDLSGKLGQKDVGSGDRRYDAALNLFFVLALESAATCADATDDAAAAVRWRKAAADLKAAVRAKFWNAERGQVETTLGVAAAPGELVQSLALLADAVPPEARADVVRKLAKGSAGWTPITLSQTLYKYEALIAAGGGAAVSAIRSMDADWKKMLDAGATSFWEMREGWSAFGNAGSLCHGWSAVPAYIYGAYPDLVEQVAPPKPENVPDLLRCEDGTPVTSVKQWEGKRRGEIMDFFTCEVYGKRPVDRPEGLVFSNEEPDKVMMDGKAIRKRIRASWKGPRGDWSFVFTAFIPKKAADADVKSPAFVLICNRKPDDNIDPTREKKSYFWPAEEIVDRGYAAIAFWNGDLAPDDQKPVFTNGVYKIYGDRGKDTWGALSAWAWGASRVMDWIETEPTLDARHVGVVGHSRGGKTALLAGVTDKRFAMACSNDSGCSGAKLNHIDLPQSETIGIITRYFRHWFSLAYDKWAGKEKEMPYDQHEWIALMAPRLVAIASATEDDWAGQLGEFHAARLASPAWELYGLKGLVAPADPPTVGDRPADGLVYQEGSVSYHIRPGTHTLASYDWHRYLDFADRHGWRRPLPKTESVWVKGAAHEMYAHYGFAAAFGAKRGDKVTLRLSAASIARVWVNGQFAGYGPARAPEGYMRVDAWPIGKFVKDGRNVVAIEVSNPAVNQFYLPERDGFLFAEVVRDGTVLAATGRDFRAQTLARVKKVNRMSYQRAPAEFWRLTPETDAWRTTGVTGDGLPLEVRPALKRLDRGAPLPDFSYEGNFRPTVRTTFTRDANKPLPDVKTLAKSCPEGPLKGFRTADLAVNLYEKIHSVVAETKGAATYPVDLAAGEGVAFRGDFMTAGFPHLTLTCTKPATVYLLMDDREGKDGLPNPLRMQAFPDACGWQLAPGDYTLDCFEPYAFSAAHLIVDAGAVTVKSFAVRSYGNPEVKRASFRCSDPAFEKIFAAAKRSLAWNAVDCFTDCPGRERAVYFGDSAYTALGADVLLGSLQMETAQFMNYALADRFHDVPDDMIPMCYPSDVVLNEPHWIPNYGLWSVIQLEGYLARGGSRYAADQYRLKAEGVLRWFRACRNADGLLENMPGWVFVEWSDARKYVKGISYVSNMIYVRFLDAMASVYGLADCAQEAEALRRTIRLKSFNGEWFTDNQTGASSELCQYAAFLSGVATPELHPVLWKRVVDNLGPARKAGVWPKICPSDLLFGYSIRLELLSERGLAAKALADVRHSFLPMAELTGTLWEGMDTEGHFSCCHGFPSVAAWVIARDALGLRKIDRKARTVTVSVPDGIPLDWCEGTIPVSETDAVTVKWRRTDGKVSLDVTLPAGWSRR